MAVFFHLEDIKYRINKEHEKKRWIIKLIKKEKYLSGNINIILTSDNSLLKINKQFLNHNSLTDVITFDYSENNIISGDIFISIDRVKENAITFECSEITELNRVIIHGILHLLKYNDVEESDKIIMKEKEQFYLKLI